MQGKALLLITNSDYEYTDRMMSFAYDRYMPEGKRWRDLFDMVQPSPHTQANQLGSLNLRMAREQQLKRGSV